MTTLSTIAPIVTSVNWSGVTVEMDGNSTVIPWGVLEAAATQQDAELAGIYGDLLRQARAAAAAAKAARVTVVNRADVQFTFEAELRDMAGQHISGRIIAADFGEQGWFPQAQRQADAAAATLRRRGWDVRTDY